MPRDLPSGTVTFLFTDIEGSTKLLHELGAEAYGAALAEHRRVIREACAAHDGVEVDTQGDAFFFAFATAPGALGAAAEMTEALASGPIRVRIGLHTGAPTLSQEGYVGGDVHRAARIASAGHGGQVLISSATAALVEPELKDLGEHRFKDLAAPEHVYQLAGGDFPALKSLYRTNLPVPATLFLGRERELSEVVELLMRDDVRLLTLTGPGGAGKTRLALQAAAEVSYGFADGVWWVPLASLRDPQLVLESAAQALDGTDELSALIDGKRLLLVLDSFEHLVEAAPGVSELRAACPELTLLVTSRELLRVAGEHTYRVPTLDPADALNLFVARARAASPDFAGNAVVADICTRLDNLPLALELAAARVRILSAEQLLERLSQRLDLLKGGRDADPRQGTLRATIAWSYDLLAEGEQLLLDRLSVFSGGCTLDAAEEVAEADLDSLQSLVDKSLLRHAGERFWMLETIRAYAAERLASGSEPEDLRDRHLAYFLELVEEAEPELTGPEQRRWYDVLALEEDNVREALTFACDRGDGERALMLAGTIWRFWWTRGQIAEASRWYERAFAIRANASEKALARGLFGAAHMAESRGDVEQTRIQFEQAAALLRALGETRWLVLALSHLAGTYEVADPRRAEAIQVEALGLATESGDLRGAAIVKGNLGKQLLERGQDQRAEELIQEALEAHRALGDVYATATSLTDLAVLGIRHGEIEVAATELRESLKLSSSIRDALTLTWTISIAAAVVLARGDPRTAAGLCAAAEAQCRLYGFDLSQAEREDDTVNSVRNALGADFDQAWAAGAVIDLDDAVALALDALEPWGTDELR